MARMERSNQRLLKIVTCLCVVCAVLGLLLYFSHVKSEKALKDALLDNNQKWIEMWKEYDFESYEYQQDGTGVNIIGDRNGVRNYGANGQETTQNP